MRYPSLVKAFRCMGVTISGRSLGLTAISSDTLAFPFAIALPKSSKSTRLAFNRSSSFSIKSAARAFNRAALLALRLFRRYSANGTWSLLSFTTGRRRPSALSVKESHFNGCSALLSCWLVFVASSCLVVVFWSLFSSPLLLLLSREPHGRSRDSTRCS